MKKNNLKISQNDTFIAPGAHLNGSVELKNGANIWYNTVLRGDGPIFVG